MAAVLTCGVRSESPRRVPVIERWGAALSHRSAAELWQLLDPRHGPAHVAVAGRTGRRKREAIEIHRPRLLPSTDVTSQLGIPVTTPARTIADLRRAISMNGTGRVSTKELRRAIREADVLGLPLREPVAHDHTRSDLESAFLRLCQRHRLPQPEVNARVESMLVDFLWRDERLVVETDGYRYHRGRAAFEDDRARDLQLRALGFDVIRLSARQVAEEPKQVALTLRRALGVAP